MPSQTLTPSGDPVQLQCRHIKTDGLRCGSPALRHQPFCYYHGTARRPGPRQPQVLTATDRKSSTFNLPSPADLNERSGVQLALALILHKIANNEIDPRRAGLLLYGLQIASGNLKGDRPDKTALQPDPVEEITEDPTHGPLAPEAELGADEPMDPGRRYLRDLINRMEALPDKHEPLETTSIPRLQAKATSTPNRACRRLAGKLLRHATEPQTAPPIPANPKHSHCRPSLHAKSRPNPCIPGTLPQNPGRPPAHFA